MAGIKDIAKLTGLSLATISRVFNDSPLVSKKTKDKVLKAAKKLDYQPNLMAAALRSGKSKIIGVVVPEINNSFFSKIINGIEQKANAHKYTIIIAQSHESKERETKAIQSLIQSKVDGILISISKETDDFDIINRLDSNGTPIVFFDRIPPLENVNQVVFDDYEGAYIATKHLIEQRCNRIIHIAGNPKISIHKKRQNGFIDALKKNNYPFIESDIIHLTMDESEDIKTIQKLLKNKISFDGVFAHGDESCLYLLNVLKTIGVSVPKNVKLIGFGNNKFSELIQPKLSTIDQRCLEMGELATSRLLELLKSKNRMNPETTILSPKLIIRASSSF
ncbi:LacI family DNA-binding transcriptional regulator [Croceitalea marina]|uniref:LacI family DNA-binding transcriptional regulator n=1 Tax=Croceitalea marina TaxID=1775166 RepID=A0ABW5MXR1_9FLAO